MIRFPRPILMVAVCVLALAGTGRAWAAPEKSAAKVGRYAGEYRQLAKPTWRRNFPNLSGYQVTGPSTGRTRKGSYNCIANTLKISNRWVWPGKKLADFDRLYGAHGYTRLRKIDYRKNARLDKIVLYGKVNKYGKTECTHGARQLPDGSWSSKLGAGPLIRHTSPKAVDGPSYGKPIAVYVKTRKIVKE